MFAKRCLVRLWPKADLGGILPDVDFWSHSWHWCACRRASLLCAANRKVSNAGRLLRQSSFKGLSQDVEGAHGNPCAPTGL